MSEINKNGKNRRPRNYKQLDAHVLHREAYKLATILGHLPKEGTLYEHLLHESRISLAFPRLTHAFKSGGIINLDYLEDQQQKITCLRAFYLAVGLAERKMRGLVLAENPPKPPKFERS